MPALLKDLDLDEISLVDFGANPGAKVILFKRRAPQTEADDMPDGNHDDQIDVSKAIDEAVKRALEKAQADQQQAISKAVDEAVKKAQTEAQARIEKAEASAKQANDTLAQQVEVAKRHENIAKLRSFKHLPLDVEKVADVYKALDVEQVKVLDAAFTAADSVVKQANIFSELGSSAATPVDGTAYAEVMAKADEIVKRDKISKAAAVAKVCEDHPEIYQRYQAERPSRRRPAN